MLVLYGGVTNLQLAPDGIVTQIYPLKGNEEAIGHNLLQDPERRRDALLTIKSKKLTVAGPLDLVQGGKAVIGRLPVFLGEDNKDFWGFTIVLIKMDQFYKTVHLDQLKKNNLQYELWSKDAESGNREVFGRSSKEKLNKPVTASIAVPNGQWRLSLAPDQGWTGSWFLVANGALVIFVALLGAFLVNSTFIRLDEKRQQEKRVEYLAYHDVLTRLPIRTYVQEYFPKVAAQAKRNQEGFGILFMDIDKFKKINDQFGHEVGDEVLVEVADRLRKAIRENDLAARFGGDEFIIILTGVVSESSCFQAVKRIKKEVARPFIVNNGAEVDISVSIGISIYPQDAEEFEGLIHEADAALCKVKKGGGHGLGYKDMNEAV